jgi:hypothetical protein
MTDEPANTGIAAPEPSPVFAEATRLFNLWLEALDAMMASRSKEAGDAAQAATAALIAHLDAHPADDALNPVRERLAIVFQRLRQEEAGKPD